MILATNVAETVREEIRDADIDHELVGEGDIVSEGLGECVKVVEFLVLDSPVEPD